AGLPTGESDPPLSLLKGYHNLYRQLGRPSLGVTPESGMMATQMPPDYRPLVAATQPIRKQPPSAPVLLPLVVRVDIIFSLVVRDVHPQRDGIRAKGYEHLLHLTYAPVVTLH